MTFTSPTDDICIQEGTFAFSYKASGTVYAGQAVTAVGTMQVEVAANAEDAFIGVPDYYATDGEMVAIYGPGNIVRMIAADGIAAGADVQVSGSEGKVTDCVAATAGQKIGVALETAASADDTIRIQLV